jgi:hypothetical protein
MAEALAGYFSGLITLQINSTFPENLSNLTLLPSPPEPIPEPDHELFALTVPFMIVTFKTAELLYWRYPLPISEPGDELLALIFPFMIITFKTVELLLL